MYVLYAVPANWQNLGNFFWTVFGICHKKVDIAEDNSPQPLTIHEKIGILCHGKVSKGNYENGATF